MNAGAELAELSVILAIVVSQGGGRLVHARRPGWGRYRQLVGNTLVPLLPVVERQDADGRARLYPARWETGDDGRQMLVPVVTDREARIYTPQIRTPLTGGAT